MSLRRATDAETGKCTADALAWLATTKVFNDAKLVAMTAVAEYIANQKGYSIYTSAKGTST